MIHAICLTISILFEIFGTFCLKMSIVENEQIWFYLSMMCYLTTFYVFSKALKGIQLDVAYAPWSGVGTLITTCVNVLIFQGTLSIIKISSITLISIGSVGLIL
jgi:small multidrug resistance pump